MKNGQRNTLLVLTSVVLAALMLLAAPATWADEAAPGPMVEAAAEAEAAPAPEEATEAKPRMEIYGHVMTDAGYNGGSSDPDWFDVMRPTKLPAYENEFGEDGEAYFSVRQTRFGIKSWLPVGDKEIFGIFEWELFGVGGDAGQTTFRLRHAYLEYEQFGAGQVPGARSWTSTSFPTPSSTGAPAAWSSSATSSCAGCRSRATPG